MATPAQIQEMAVETARILAVTHTMIAYRPDLEIEDALRMVHALATVVAELVRTIGEP